MPSGLRFGIEVSKFGLTPKASSPRKHHPTASAVVPLVSGQQAVYLGFLNPTPPGHALKLGGFKIWHAPLLAIPQASKYIK